MMKDLQGNSISEASAEAVDYYNQAVSAFNIYTGDPFSLVNNAIEVSPHFAMAHIFKAYLLGLATEPVLNGYAKDTVRHLKTMHLSDREASHLGALDLMLHGEWTAAALVLDIHNCNYPMDIVALQGRVTEGVKWMAMREAYWSGNDNFFKVHNWWHRALYHQDLGQPCPARYY